LFVLRIQYIKSFLINSKVVKGIIKDVWFYKDRGRIECVFENDNGRYQYGQAIMKNKFTKQLKKGQVIDILIRSNENNKALIQDLYFDYVNQ
jgi:hypothetical protein